MHKIIFDSNIFNKIDDLPQIKERIKKFVDSGEIIVIIPSTIERELNKKPFYGVPNWFKTQIIGDSVFILDYSHLDCDRLGNGNTYNKHKGNSTKIKDAIIADTANRDADIFVSDDKRCRERLKKMSDCQSLTFIEFLKWLSVIDSKK